ncbi:MAG: hypothetical protein EBT57_07500 [Verrucomicrobia bacterium]|nr:hypothetical protein [Verrucomicrobiota bacterium]
MSPRFLGLLLVALSPLLSGCQSSRSMSNLVALFTDFGSGDPYVGQLKGAIKTIHPESEILDLSHENAAFDIATASYLLAKSTRTLPAGTVIVAVVDPGVGSSREGLVVRTQTGRIYVAPDNGLLTEVLAREGLAEKPGSCKTPNSTSRDHRPPPFMPGIFLARSPLTLFPGYPSNLAGQKRKRLCDCHGRWPQ